MHAHRHILLAINNTSTLQTDTREHTNTETWHCHNPTSSTQKESHGCTASNQNTAPQLLQSVCAVSTLANNWCDYSTHNQDNCCHVTASLPWFYTWFNAMSECSKFPTKYPSVIFLKCIQYNCRCKKLHVHNLITM